MPAQGDLVGHGSIRLLPIANIRRDGLTQHRSSLDAEIVAEYAALMSEGVAFPPVRVWWDGEYYWLSDGFRRIAAAEGASLSELSVEVRLGSLSDARWDSFAANATHGSRRTGAETEAVVQMALLHENAVSLGNVEIAKHLHVTEATVRRWRKRLSSSRDEDRVRLVTRKGATYALSTVNIGKTGVAVRKKPRRDLGAELAGMRERASEESRALLSIIQHWVQGLLTPEDCVVKLERAVRARVGAEKAALDAIPPGNQATRGGGDDLDVARQ